MSIITKYTLMYELDEQKSLMINSLTGSMDIINEQSRVKIEDMIQQKKQINEQEDHELYANLKQRGYLFENSVDEQKVLNKYKLINDEINKNKLITHFTICPSMGCNLRCTYCFESDDQHANFNLMTKEQLEVIFQYIDDTLKKNKEHGNKLGRSISSAITIFGGEPLLKNNFLLVEKILEFASEKHIEVKIITNGTTADFYLELLKKHADIVSLQITLDGGSSTHNVRRIRHNGKGTFDQITRNLEKIISAGIRVALRINVDKENLFTLDELGRIVEEKKWNANPLVFIYASPVMDFCGLGETTLKEYELLDYLLESKLYAHDTSFIKSIVSPTVGYLNAFFDTELKKKPWKFDYCEATAGTDLCFSPDGNITTCLTYAGKGKYVIGKFDEKGVVLHEDEKKKWFERSIFKLEKCQECKYALMCGGGCVVNAIERNQDMEQAVCGDIAKTIESFVRYKKEALLSR